MEQRAWLLLAAGLTRQHAGNEGYHDQIDAFYSWDESVPRHADLAEGDQIALWDKTALLGVAKIDQITVGSSEKLSRRCPFCSKTTIKIRTTVRPAFRCHSCSNTFDEPLDSTRQVKTYRAHYAPSWIDLDGAMSGPELRTVCTSQKSQLSLRPLNWPAFVRALQTRIPDRLARRVTANPQTTMGAEGHRLGLTRARRGQGEFRSGLLAKYGENCAITGACPAVTLEAAHLYSYADVGRHFEHGGLLLRRDVHRLFDRGDLAVDPSSLRVDVDPYVSSFENYRSIHGIELRARVNSQQFAWIQRHWSQHRDPEVAVTG